MTDNQQKAHYVIDANEDGSAIVKLARPVRFLGEDHARLTIPRITGRHLRRATWHLGERMSMGHVVAFAAEIVEPVGIFDELPAYIARDLGVEVMLLLGKSETTGGALSPT